MHHLHDTYAVLGVAGVVLALASRRVRRWPVSEPLVALLLGVALGPLLLGVVDLPAHERDLLLLEGSRLLLAWSVMAAALRFPARDLRPLVRPTVLLLVVVMPLAAVLGGASALLVGLPVAAAFLVGAVLCPTDPVLAASVVSGDLAEKTLPARLRQVLTLESGANDGLALPLVALALAAVLPQETLGGAVAGLLQEVLVGAVVGLAAGWLAGRGLHLASAREDLGNGPRLVFTLLLAVAVLGVARVLGGDGVLAAFVAGLAYNRLVPDSDRSPQDAVDEAVNRYAVLPLFLVLGAVLPWSGWVDLGPGAIAFAVLVLLVRRLPVVLAAARPLGLRGRDAVFAGWFGPMGVSAVFYLAHSLHRGVDDPRVFAAGTLAIAVSVVAFGVSASPLTRLYGDRAR
ncbi:cation:proton antiporter [Paenibacillus sp. TRM 82003]|uniref:cation:proton antiporter domain-containing protein n=1 Tax=Kineococcus sp. TRM81007 TaxID=2925831 RepID=UPI001F5922F2|nr:cation:proton antiporter [Kineococcus sp. TRM81007]MCI2240087.1 cation:proton antiporter [Kineococcus sp. TRM81007]MCI3925607.1 cation:proton antiporter [Paenibacillus sp. TRM 82003]